MKVKIFTFLSLLFQNKDFISQESPILADVENIIEKKLIKNTKKREKRRDRRDVIEKK